MKRIYISGPMEGKPDLNVDAFNSMQIFLESFGYQVVNPVHVDVDPDFLITDIPTRLDYYRKDIRALTYCDGIMMLKGWNVSHGAQLERTIAQEMGLIVIYEDQIEDGAIKFRENFSETG